MHKAYLKLLWHNSRFKASPQTAHVCCICLPWSLTIPNLCYSSAGQTTLLMIQPVGTFTFDRILRPEGTSTTSYPNIL